MKFLYFGSNIQKFTLLTALSIVILRVGKKIVKIILENLNKNDALKKISKMISNQGLSL